MAKGPAATGDAGSAIGRGSERRGRAFAMPGRRPMFVEELLELAKGVQQVVLVPDQRAELRGYGVLPGIMQVDA